MYLTLQQLIDHYGEQEVISLFDVENVGEVQAEKFNILNTTAKAEIDSALRGRYSLPIEPAPAELVSIAATLVMEGGYRAQGAPSHIADQAKIARQQLKEFANGIRRLEVKGDAQEEPNNAFGARQRRKAIPVPGSIDESVNCFSDDRGTYESWRQ